MYTLAAFRQIEETMSYTLPDDVFQLLETLTLKVGGNASLLSKGKATKETLVGLLNKLTTDTYNAISAKVLSANPTPDTMRDVFKVAAGNMFYSKVYARLCHQLLQKNESLKDEVMQLYATYKQKIMDRKATLGDKGTTLFLANLALNGTLDVSEGVAMAHAFQTLVEEDSKGDEEVVAVWVEHVALLMTQTKAFTDACALEPRIQLVLKLDTKVHKGVSLKTVFKYMDVLEHFQ
jgi:hypothetical protein